LTKLYRAPESKPRVEAIIEQAVGGGAPDLSRLTESFYQDPLYSDLLVPQQPTTSTGGEVSLGPVSADIFGGVDVVSRIMMIVAEVSVTVLGEGSSISRFVRVAVEALKRSGLKTLPGPNGTSLEAVSIDQILNAVKAAHMAVVDAGAKRVVTTLKIDDRRDKPATIETKLRAINQHQV
jgi:uncharacterized protein (TIGR00106 family)